MNLLSDKLLKIINDRRFAISVLFLMLLTGRIFLLTQFSFKYTCSDDLIFWQSASDYLRGIFHEPYFYGQNYNFMLESLPAIPMLAIGLPHFMALPLSTLLFALFPFLLFSFVLFRNGHDLAACIFLLIPLTLPIEYDLVTSMTRGFISGTFFTGFLVYCLLHPTSIKSYIILGLTVSVSYILNPNSLVLSFPVSLYLLFENYNKPLFYWIPVLFAIPFFSLEYYARQFYISNPEFLVHKAWEMKFSMDLMLDGFLHMDRFFGYLTPVFWKGNWVVLPVILILAIKLMKTNWKKGLSLALSVVFFLGLMGMHKVNDGMDTIFFTSVRMFLGIPLVLGVGMFWLTNTVKFNERLWTRVILGIGCIVLFIKILETKSVIQKHTELKNHGSIALSSIEDLKKRCAEWKEQIRQYDADLIVYVVDWKYGVPELEFYNYACPLLESELPQSIINVFERRTWIFVDEKDHSRDRVLIFNPNIDSLPEITPSLKYERIEGRPNLILITENDKSLSELSELFHFGLMRNTYVY